MVLKQPLSRPAVSFSLLDLAPDGVCQSSPSLEKIVSSYLAFSPLPLIAFGFRGGLFSVTLSMLFQALTVSEHLTVWCSDFPLPDVISGATIY